ncbi:AraC family transcriptional regulator [Bacillus sp. PS06]|uniref:AraC family transcriptional regulator n=1 Tax=Bacillus sp. PS06 TaxID=2764176 RepID=UPI00177D2AFD|nr:helix-turn-helix domain-containing protein [Bacillus sp. PS06]MBD8069698.1 helix-turn-helix domain-containing protein [Bacillus sp. PS06]
MDSLKQVACEKRSYSREFTTHQHEFGQFLFPLQGSLDIQTNWQELNLTPDYCFYLPPTYEHNYRSKDRNEFLIVDIPLKYLPANTSCMYMRLDKKWAAIRYLLLEETMNQEDPTALVDLTKYVTNKLKRSEPPSIEYVHKHYKEIILLEDLAKIEHYHPVYYSAWFKKKTGKSLKAYISELRLKEVKNLLISTSWTISKISEEVGFENSSSFTRWFVKCEGVSPQKYRILNNG